MASYQSKDSIVLGRQLEAQEIHAVFNAVAGTSDLPSCIEIDNGTIADTELVIDLKEDLDKVFLVQVLNKETGANVVLESQAISGSKLTIVIDGTALTSACVKVVYKVKE